jgi:hypothetical protein
VPSKKASLFHVTVDGKPIRSPVGADISSLEVGFFCGRSGPANLHIGGLRSKNGVAARTESVTRHVQAGKIVAITYLENHVPPTPLDPELLMANIERMQEQWEKDYGPTVELPPEQPSYKRLRAFSVKAPSNSQRVSARLDRDAHLSAQIYWTDGRCTLRVRSILVQSDGSTRGKQFIAMDLRPRQRVSLELLDTSPNLPRCSFCGKFKDEVNGLIAGNSAFICHECVAEAQRLIRTSN